MTKSKPTPGEWKIGYAVKGAFQIEDEDGAVLCTRNYWESRAAESEANARLIAAAPNMLEALKGIRANLIRLAWEENSLMIEGIDKVIMEAEGNE